MTTNPESVLDSTKKILGFDAEYTAFDLDITTAINAAFGSLQQLGVGDADGFSITDNTTLWADYISSVQLLNLVKQFIYMSVRLSFDPPATSFGLESISAQILQLTWRINVSLEAEMPPTDPFVTA